MKVILTSKPTGSFFSIEAGMSDGKKNFDHHGAHHTQPGPCKDDRITLVGDDDIVEITHIDADTFVGLLRMAGAVLPKVVDFNLMEKIDLNGSSVCNDKFNTTLLYVVGIGQISRDLKFPRVTDMPTDVTAIIMAMMAKTDDEIITIGREATEKSEKAYSECCIAKNRKVGYWVVGANDPFDQSRPYEDGIEIVIVHRTHYKTISLYSSPESGYTFSGKTIAGIEFGGHPKAAGSPRGTEYNAEDGKKVFEALIA